MTGFLAYLCVDVEMVEPSRRNKPRQRDGSAESLAGDGSGRRSAGLA